MMNYYFTALSIFLIMHMISDFPLQRIFYRKYERNIISWKRLKFYNIIFSLNPFHALIDLKFTLHRAHTPDEDQFWDKLAIDQVLHLVSCFILSIPFAFL
jgi:hypothetical protein